MSGFASAQAAYEAPADEAPLAPCPVCDGSGVITECANDGTHGCSHTNDREFSCAACEGTGEVVGADHPDWCDRCGLSGACPDCNPPDRDDF